MNSCMSAITLSFFSVMLSCASIPAVHAQSVERTLSVHEWGTFTSVAGSDGNAVEWQPITFDTQLANELPSFVEELKGVVAKLGLRATMRMETPVIYFYSPNDLKVSVHVAFACGLITDWYPRVPGRLERGWDLAKAYGTGNMDGDISWNNVELQPQQAPNFPRDDTDNRYYAARETSSTPLRVITDKGEQHEKFLFYRGVSHFLLPISAKATPDNRLLVANLMKVEIPAIILFERRGDKVGYRVGGSLKTTSLLNPPELTGSVESLCDELEQLLTSRGLFPDEAHAMVETWRNSWFEEGSRLIYILPSEFVDTILPLTIKPAPATTVRAFVGRLEIITPATQKAVAAAMASRNRAELNKYSRFLEPITRIIDEQKHRW